MSLSHGSTGTSGSLAANVIENVKRISGHSTRWLVIAVLAAIAVGFVHGPWKNVGFALAFAPVVAILVALRFGGEYAWVAIAAIFVDIDKFYPSSGDSIVKRVLASVGNAGEKTQEAFRSVVLWTFGLYTTGTTLITYLPTENHPRAYLVGLILLPLSASSILAAAGKSESRAGRTFTWIGNVLMTIFVVILIAMAVSKIKEEPEILSSIDWVKKTASSDSGAFMPNTFTRGRLNSEKKGATSPSDDIAIRVTDITVTEHGEVVGFKIAGRSVIDVFVPDGTWYRESDIGKTVTDSTTKPDSEYPKAIVHGTWGFNPEGVVTGENGRSLCGWAQSDEPGDGLNRQAQFCLVERDGDERS